MTNRIFFARLLHIAYAARLVNTNTGPMRKQKLEGPAARENAGSGSRSN